MKIMGKGIFRVAPNSTPARPPELPKEQLHEMSVEQYPELTISPDEYVMTVVNRHPIGILSIWGLVGLVIITALFAMGYYAMNRTLIAKTLSLSPTVLPDVNSFSIIMLIVIVLFFLGGLVTARVYEGNRFYVTNESIIQFIQTSLFATQSQIVNLINVDDVSFRQEGILQHVFNYGTIRVSTEGDRASYQFMFVSNPSTVVRTINMAFESAIARVHEKE